MGLLEICCENQPSDCFEIVTFAGLASQGDAREAAALRNRSSPQAPNQNACPAILARSVCAGFG